MRTMYDSVTAGDIPATAQMVAGYVNGTFAWSDADWARFPNAVKVRIATRASVNDGHVLDVEPGNATPAEAVSWVLMRRGGGFDPSVYCSQLSVWPAVRQAFRDRGVPEPDYWVARYDNVTEIPAGAVAKQYANPPVHGQGHFDLSAVADFWPGVDQQQEDDMFTDTDRDKLDGLDRSLGATWQAGKGLAGEVLIRLETKLDALTGALSDDEARVLAAIRALQTEGQADVQAFTLALVNAVNQLGTLVARASDDQMQQLRTHLEQIPVDVRYVLVAALTEAGDAG